MDDQQASRLRQVAYNHQEPAWFIEKRLAAQKLLLNNIDLPQMQRFKFDNWPFFSKHDIDLQIAESIEKNAVTTNEFNVLQIGQTTCSLNLPPKYQKQGVIFTDIFTALKKYPEMIKKYFMTEVIKVDEDRITAYHQAFVNAGLFLYVPKNVEINIPIKADLVQDSRSETSFNPHLLIVAGKNSKLKFVQHLKTIGSCHNTMNMAVEIWAEDGSHVEFSSLEEIGKNTTLYFNKRANIMRDAYVEWAVGLMNDCNTVGNIDSELIGDGSYAYSKAIAVTTDKQHVGINNRVINRGPHSTGLINQRGVLLDNSRLIFNGIGQIKHGAHGSKADQQNRVLMMSDNAHGDANPLLLIDENDVIAAHAASVGPVDPIQMNYLMSRGIPFDQAERLVIRGFLGAVLDVIPAVDVRHKMINILERKLINGQNRYRKDQK